MTPAASTLSHRGRSLMTMLCLPQDIIHMSSPVDGEIKKIKKTGGQIQHSPRRGLMCVCTSGEGGGGWRCTHKKGPHRNAAVIQSWNSGAADVKIARGEGSSPITLKNKRNSIMAVHACVKGGGGL